VLALVLASCFAPFGPCRYCKFHNAIGKGINLVTEFANFHVKQSADLICKGIRSGLAIENTRWVLGCFLRQFFIAGM